TEAGLAFARQALQKMRRVASDPSQTHHDGTLPRRRRAHGKSQLRGAQELLTRRHPQNEEDEIDIRAAFILQSEAGIGNLFTGIVVDGELPQIVPIQAHTMRQNTGDCVLGQLYCQARTGGVWCFANARSSRWARNRAEAVPTRKSDAD